MSARFLLGEAALAAGAEVMRAGSATDLRGVFTDTRAPAQGGLFVALRGERYDGSAFVLEAVRGGAAAVLVPRASIASVQAALAETPVAVLAAQDTGRALLNLARAWRGQMANLRCVCITGSAGKTSTKELVAQVLSASAPTLKTEGNLNNEIGVPLTLLQLEAAHRFAVIECGMNHLGEIARLASAADPDLALVTNVGPVHLEGCGSLDGVAQAKGELFHALRSDGVAIANADDPRVLAQAVLSGRKRLTFGAQASADVQLVSAHHGGAGLQIALRFGSQGQAFETHSLELQLLGVHNGLNAAAAAAVGLALGLDTGTIVKGLAQARTPGRRMRPVQLESGALLIDDCYNANPSSTKAALVTLSQLASGRQGEPGLGRSIAVLGDMLELGPTELDLHRDVGRFAAGTGLARLICFGARARTIGEGAIEAGLDAAKVKLTDDPAEAARSARGAGLSAGDTILVKGSRGMKMERISDALSGSAAAPGGH